MKSNSRVDFFYLRSGANAFSVWQHSPGKSQIKNNILIICPPAGYEYNHTYRTLRRLAEKLSDAGYLVFRFDYYGTGDSSGSVLDEGCLQNWQQNIQFLREKIKETFPEFTQTLLGLRLGGMLATMSAVEQDPASLILWEPIINGRAYIREMEAISRLAANSSATSDDVLESAGFMLAKSTTEQIKKINLLKGSSPARCNVLHITRDDNQQHDKLREFFTANEINYQSYAMTGYNDMMAEPHDTIVPHETIDVIADWLNSVSADTQVKSISVLNGDRVLCLTQDQHVIEETPVFFGEYNAMFGILSQPKEKSDKPCIVLANSGSVHHVGPNSVYTMMARKLTALGYPVFRFDLENIGDSQVTDKLQENHPYQPNAIANLHEAVRYLEKQIQPSSFIIGGICSGAYTSFHAGLELTNHNVSELLVINPLTFYWKPGMSLEIPSALNTFNDHAYYKQSLMSLEKWKKLISGKANGRYIFDFLRRRGREYIKQFWREIIGLVLGEQTMLAKDLKKIHKQGKIVTFLFAETDPGLDIVRSQARKTLVKGGKEKWLTYHIINEADHTFTTKQMRENLLQTLEQHFAK